jgi:glycosyltransferase involved in cell wall biosynthesis
MKIAVVCDVIYPWVVGGGEKRYYEVFTRLAKKHDVHFYTMFYKGMPSREFEYNGIKVHCICDAPNNLYSGGRRKIFPAIKFSSYLYSQLMKEKFDLIESNEFPFFPCFTAKLVAKMQKIPLFITWHEVWGDYWYHYLGVVGFFGKLIEKLVSKLPEKIISVSSSTSNKLKKELEVNEDKIATINNGVDLEFIKKVDVKKEKNKVIFVGRLIPEKNVDLLLKNIPKNFKLTIVGEGPEMKNLKELAKQLKKVEFKGFIRDYKELIREIKSSSLFVLLSEREGFSISALEAIACKTPVLALKNSLPKEIENLCYLTNKWDIRENLLKYTNSKPPNNIGKFDWNKTAESVEKLYMRTLS